MPSRFAAALALSLAGAAAGEERGGGRPASGAVLELENADRGRALSVALAVGEPFSVTSQHSMYDAPVTEQFEVGPDGHIVLRMVSSPSAAVREYFGITAAGERHAIDRVFPEVVFRIATGTPQRLRIGALERSFLELGERGDRVVMRATIGRRRPAHAAGAGP